MTKERSYMCAAQQQSTILIGVRCDMGGLVGTWGLLLLTD